MPSRTTLHLPDGRSLPVSRSALDEALSGLSDGASLRLETRNGAWMTATRTPEGPVLSYRLWERMARYESAAVSAGVAADVLLDFSEAGSGWPSAVSWREVEAAPEPVSPRAVMYAEARSGGQNAVVRYALTRSYGLFVVVGMGVLIGWGWNSWIGALLVSLGFVYEAVAGILSGEVLTSRGKMLRQDDYPMAFVFLVATWGTFGGVCFVLILINLATG